MDLSIFEIILKQYPPELIPAPFSFHDNMLFRKNKPITLTKTGYSISYHGKKFHGTLQQCYYWLIFGKKMPATSKYKAEIIDNILIVPEMELTQQQYDYIKSYAISLLKNNNLLWASSAILNSLCYELFCDIFTAKYKGSNKLSTKYALLSAMNRNNKELTALVKEIPFSKFLRDCAGYGYVDGDGYQPFYTPIVKRTP